MEVPLPNQPDPLLAACRRDELLTPFIFIVCLWIGFL